METFHTGRLFYFILNYLRDIGQSKYIYRMVVKYIVYLRVSAIILLAITIMSIYGKERKKFMIKTVLKYPNGLIFLAAVACWVLLSSLYLFSPPVNYERLTTEKVIALTVDDGPDPKFSPQAVEILKKHGAKATFFVVGSQVERYPQVLEMEINAGNEIGNHSYSHKKLSQLNRKQMDQEIKRTNGIIFKNTGHHVIWFRPPYGQYNMWVVEDARDEGMSTVMWTSVVECKRLHDPVKMAQKVINEARPGGIILFHDSRLDRTNTIKALPMIIEGLKKKGYRFVTLSELFESEGKTV